MLSKPLSLCSNIDDFFVKRTSSRKTTMEPIFREDLQVDIKLKKFKFIICEKDIVTD